MGAERKMKTFELHESVRIKATAVTGVVVAEDTNGDTKPLSIL